MLNLNIIKKVSYVFVIMLVAIFSVFNYTIANTTGVYLSSIKSVKEGSNITFNVIFGNEVEVGSLSDGDVILRGFRASVSIIKNSEKSYTVTLSNVNGAGDGKYVVINQGVGYIDGKGATDSVSSNAFTIAKKDDIYIHDKDNNNSNSNSNNNNNNATNNSGNNNQNISSSNDNKGNSSNNVSNNGVSNVANNTSNNNKSNVGYGSNNKSDTETNSEQNNENEQEKKNEEKQRKQNPNTGKI